MPVTEGIDRYDGNIKSVKWSSKNYDTYLDPSLEIMHEPKLSYQNNIVSVAQTFSEETGTFKTVEGFLHNGYFEFQVLQQDRGFNVGLTTDEWDLVVNNFTAIKIRFDKNTPVDTALNVTITIQHGAVSGPGLGSFNDATTDRTYAVGDVFRIEKSETFYTKKKWECHIYMAF